MDEVREIRRTAEAWEFKGELYPTEIQAKRAAHNHYWWNYSRLGFWLGFGTGLFIGIGLPQFL